MKRAIIEPIVSRAALERDRLCRIVDILADAILLVDGKGNLLHANEAARRAFADQRSGLPSILRGARLRRDGGAGDRRGPSRSDVSREDVMVLTTEDGIRRVCHAARLPEPPLADPCGEPSLQVLVIRAADKTAAATKVVQSLFGLTDRERDVLFSLVEIGGIPDTAAALNIALGTARTHVKALFAKTGTSRQSELVRLVADVTGPFRPGSCRARP